MDRVSISRIITVAALLMAYAASATAQEYVAPAVEVSDQKVKKDGKVYYSHVVVEKQTLFSISKAYNVTQDEIYDANPGLRENGLKKNSIIMIPVQSENKETVAARQTETPNETVAQQESVQADETKKVEASVHKIHTVRWYETLKDIAARHNVSEQAIMTINNLTDSKLKNRQKLIIPTQEYAMALTPSSPEEEPQTAEEEDMDLETAFDTEEDDSAYTVIEKRKINATLLLPLKATGNTASKSNMDFYSGALIAVRELGESGIDINMNVYDVANGTFGATRHELESSDIEIGRAHV